MLRVSCGRVCAIQVLNALRCATLTPCVALQDYCDDDYSSYYANAKIKVCRLRLSYVCDVMTYGSACAHNGNASHVMAALQNGNVCSTVRARA